MSAFVPRRVANVPTSACALAAALLVLAVIAGYANSFQAPFVFDDIPTIVENATLRHLWPLSDVLWPRQPGGLTTSGRPLVNLSFAVNHALSGNHEWSYHLVNLLIHAVACLTLFGIIRRTLDQCRRGSGGGRTWTAGRMGFSGREATADSAAASGTDTLLFAALAAALWALHPLQTEAVTYIVQRAESLAALFYLLTLYAFLRAVETPASDVTPAASAGVGRRVRAGWSVLTIGACAAAMASKEIAVSAPLIVFLYDRTFIAGTFRGAWNARWKLHVALGATWLLLAALVLATGGRGGTAGYAPGTSAWNYALTQCQAIPHYVGLWFWPDRLVFDYGLATVKDVTTALPGALAIVGAIAATAVALVRAPVAGFLGTSFFAVLAPSSSVVPVLTQTAAEHRMYLPGSALAVLVMLAVWSVLGRRAAIVLMAVVIAFGVRTAARNRTYATEVDIWADTAAKLPTNARAHNNLGQALFRAGRKGEAIASYQRALTLQPFYPETHYNLGVALADRGDRAAAIEHYETALRYQPAYPEAENNLANALVNTGAAGAALPHYEAALRLKPDFAEARNNLGNALLQLGRAPEAIQHLRRAIELKGDYPEACYNLGNALAATGDMNAALRQYEQAIRLKPAYAAAHVNAGNALLALGRPNDAIGQYEAALAIDANLAEARLNLGLVLIDGGRWTEAVAQLESAVRLDPNAPPARRALGYALGQTGRTAEAIAEYEAYLRLAPDDADARTELRRLQAALRK